MNYGPQWTVHTQTLPKPICCSQVMESCPEKAFAMTSHNQTGFGRIGKEGNPRRTAHPLTNLRPRHTTKIVLEEHLGGISRPDNTPQGAGSLSPTVFKACAYTTPTPIHTNPPDTTVPCGGSPPSRCGARDTAIHQHTPLFPLLLGRFASSMVLREKRGGGREEGGGYDLFKLNNMFMAMNHNNIKIQNE